MKRLPRRSNWHACLGFCLALLTGGVAGGTPSLAQQQNPILLGPRSLYPLTDRLRSRSDIPLVMRDAVEHIANGTRLLAIGPRIMGGEPAPVGAYPWMASLELKVRRADAHFCGGAFIAPQWVITAAHCVRPNSAGEIDVLGGTNTLDSGGTLFPVDRVIVHEKYSTETQDYDVALLHLSKPFTGTIVRLLTPADAERLLVPGSLAISAGWGYTGEGGNVSNVLRNVTVQIVSNQTCNGLASYAGAVTPRMVCAGFPQGGKDSCQGDSGGPLMVADGNGGYFQAGIVSWGEGCGRPQKFGVYTRASVIADWVAEKIGTKAVLAAPMASNAVNAPSTAAKREPAKSESEKTRSANAEPAGVVRAGPPSPRRFGEEPKLSGVPVEPAASLVSVPLPQSRPSARARHALSRVKRGERRVGVPIDRKYSPSFPARAQVRPHPRPTIPAVRHKPRRGYYYYRGHYYRILPDDRRYNIPPSFDWRSSR